ncbi:MAG: MlaD family protein [Bacteroidota bacterium]|jgi:phospholipid/cholesterol/gamma-HCH transport system substrate-binding protein
MRKELKVGLLIIVAVGLLFYGYNILRGIDIFKKQTRLYAVFEKNEGLIEASPLLINGFKIGQINRLDLINRDTTYHVLVTFILNENVTIPKNSIARLISMDLLGTKAVSVEPGNSKTLIKDGDTLRTAYQENLSTAVRAELQPLKDKITGLVGSMDSIVTVVNEVMNREVRRNLIESFTSIKNAVVALEQSTTRVNSLIGEEQGTIVAILAKINSITKNLSDNNEKISRIIDNFEAISDTIAQTNIRQTIENTNKALTQANLLLDEVAKGESTIGKLMKDPTLYNNLNKSAVDLDLLLKDLRYNPERYLHFSVFGRKTKLKPIPGDTAKK